MRRKLSTFATLLSLVLCAATVAMCARSYWICDSIEWMSHYRQRFAACSRGRVLLQINHGPSGTNEFEPITHDAYVMKANDTQGLGRPWRFGGFWVENLSFAPSASHSAWLPYTDIIVPLYAVAVASLILPGMTLRRVIRRRTHGVCRTCGYDLRATPERCPECGTVPAATNKAPPHNQPLERTVPAV